MMMHSNGLNCEWKFIFYLLLLICFLNSVKFAGANLLSRKTQELNKDNDVIIITDFKGDSLSNLLNQLKSNSCTRPLSEQIEKTIKQSNLKLNPLISGGSGPWANSVTNHPQNIQSSRFSPFNSLFDRARLGGNKINDKFNAGTDKLSNKLFGTDNKYLGTVDRPNNDKFYRPMTYAVSSAGYPPLSDLNNNKLNQIPNQYIATGYRNYLGQNTLPNQFATYPIAYQFNNQPKDQKYIAYNSPITGYSTANYLPYTFKTSTPLLVTTPPPSTVQSTTYRPVNYDSYNGMISAYGVGTQTNLDQNKYLPINYDKSNFPVTTYANSTSQLNNLSGIRHNKPEHQETHHDPSSEYTGQSNNRSPSTLFNQYNSSIDQDADSDYDSPPTTMYFTSNSTRGDDPIRQNVYYNHRRRMPPAKLFRRPPRFPPFNNRRFNRHPSHRHLLNSPIEQHFDGSSLDSNGFNDNPSDVITNELVDSLINKLNEKKLLNKPQLDDDKSIRSIIASNQLINASFDQDDLLKNTQLLSKFEQINNKILTNLLLSTYLSNLSKSPKMNTSIKSGYLDSFENDSQDRLAESNIRYRKVRRRSQPSQIIIKKYIQVPANSARKRTKKIQRKNSNIKSPVRPLIIKKIETPSIVIETPSSKIRKNLAIRRLNALMDNNLEEDSLGGLGLGNYASAESNSLNGLTNFAGDSTYDFGINSRLSSLENSLNNYEPADNYRLSNSIGSNTFRSALLNTYHSPLSYVPTRNMYPHNNKIDDLMMIDEQPSVPSLVDENQINDIKPRRMIKNLESEYYRSARRPPYYDHQPSTTIINDQNSTATVFNTPKRIRIDYRPPYLYGEGERFVDRFNERFSGDRMTNLGNGLAINERFRENDGFRDEERIREKMRGDERFRINDTPSGDRHRFRNDAENLNNRPPFNSGNKYDKFDRPKENEKEINPPDSANNSEKPDDNRLLNHKMNDGDKTVNTEKFNESSDANKYGQIDKMDKYNSVLEKFKIEIDELNASNNSSKLVYDMPENNAKQSKQMPKLIIIDETN